MSLEEAESFTSAIKSCKTSRACDHDSRSNLPVDKPRKSCHRTPHNTLQQLTSVMPPSVDLEDLISTYLSCCYVQRPRSSRRSSYPLSTNFSPIAQDQQGFRPRHSTTSALLQLSTDIETGFNQRKPPDRTVCVAIDLTDAFDTVSHNILIYKFTGSSLPPVITRWLSCYLRVNHAATSFRGIKTSTRIISTGVPKGSKLSPSLFNYYIADLMAS